MSFSLAASFRHRGDGDEGDLGSVRVSADVINDAHTTVNDIVTRTLSFTDGTEQSLDLSSLGLASVSVVFFREYGIQGGDGIQVGIASGSYFTIIGRASFGNEGGYIRIPNEDLPPTLYFKHAAESNQLGNLELYIYGSVT